MTDIANIAPLLEALTPLLQKYSFEQKRFQRPLRRLSLPATSRNPSCPSLRAFALVELLVVIAIFAILAALLLPALSGARAQRVQRASQLKQLTIGQQLFLNDHAEQCPPDVYRTGDRQYQLTWDGLIHTYIGGIDTDADLNLGTIDPLRCPKILQCPADKDPITKSSGQ